MATETKIWPDIAIPPGELLAETLGTIGLTQAALARRTGRPTQAVNEIVRGVKQITPETALQFEYVLGVPAHIWLGLESDYRHIRARQEEQKRLEGEVALAKKFPYREMAKLGWVRRVRSAVEKARELLDFFGVSSLRYVRVAQGAAHRRSSKLNSSPEALAAWLRQAERLAQKVEAQPFNEKRLRACLSELRSLTRQPPNIFEPRLKAILSGCGAVLVLVPHLPRTGAHGAVRWITPQKALVQMSIRYRWDDIFWFSLFHELGHILLHGRRDVFIEGNNNGQDRREREADAFATEQLIPSSEFDAFVEFTVMPSPSAVVRFADKVGIAPSIVVGRLQHKGYLPYSHFNHLRARFKWVKR